MKVIFMGTPDFAVGTLEKILEAGHQVTLVVTQPDKPKGRKGELTPPPVKECAVERGIPVFQPDRIRKPENIAYLSQYEADIIVVAAFGQILPQAVLDYPRLGCINVHASLLPKYRGAAPIQWAVINGDKKTGVTIMRMDIGLDTGDIITQEEVELAADETGGSLFDKLAVTGAELCVKTMDLLENGKAEFRRQRNEDATHTAIIKKELGEIDFNRPARELECLIRGLNPWPSAYTKLDHKTFKIWKAAVLEGKESGQKPGTIVEVTKDSILVQTGDGILALEEVQLEGKKRMDAASFLRGYEVIPGTALLRI